MSEARARNTDPLSSHIAAEEMRAGGATKQLKFWLSQLKDAQREGFSDRTASELAKLYAQKKWQPLVDKPNTHTIVVDSETDKGKYQVSRRFPEGAEQGLVKADSIRQCEVTQRMCKAWSLTDLGSAAI